MDREFSEEDLRQIAALGKSKEKVCEEMQAFIGGLPYANLERPATLRDGIRKLDEDEVRRYARLFEEAASQGRVTKFVPASGTGDRMFKLLRAFAEDTEHPIEDVEHAAEEGGKAEKFLLRFLQNLEDFAFYPELVAVIEEQGHDLEALRKSGQYATILDALLSEDGLNYAHLPKGLITFHRDGENSRSAFAEHLHEAAEYTCDANSTAHIHFTVAPGHQEKVEAHLKDAIAAFPNNNISFNVSFSIQKSSTNTIAVNLENIPFRDDDGKLAFFPAGHGALLENLNALQADIIFIKNADNVVPRHLAGENCRYKKALGGLLVDLQKQIAGYLEKLGEAVKSEDLLDEIERFAIKRLSIEFSPSYVKLDEDGRYAYWTRQLNRPLRVCGMVQNEGELGGGPFWVKLRDGSSSLQIVESSQVDSNNEQQLSIWHSSTHFNPVDLVCSVRDAFGNPFDLLSYTDCQPGFIAEKTRNGRKLKVLELPGLWNGGMAHWITVFVEVPANTFAPVKTILDLLRPQRKTVEARMFA